MKSTTINIANDFSPFPAGRYQSDGQYTGEGFRKKFLVDAINEHDHVIIEFDGTLGYGSSFLEESFGGLIREEGFTAIELHDKLELRSSRKSIIDTVNEYIDKAQEQTKKESE